MKYRLKTLTGAGLRRGVLAAGSILLCGVLSGSASAANDTVALTFTYTVTEGTCTVSVPPELDFGTVSKDGSTLDAIGKPWFFIGESTLAVSLTSCAGSGTLSTSVPVVKVTGYTKAATGSQNRKDYLMMPVTSNTGLGMVMTGKDGTLTPGGTTGLMKLTATTLVIDVGDAGIPPKFGSSTVNLTVALACGDTSDCTTSNLRPGMDSMTLTFAFGYR